MFQETLRKWLSRNFPSRGMRAIDSGAVALATDIGLKRTENQDRVVVMKFVNQQTFYTVAVLVDGMGGMRDGKECATLAISSFLNSILENSQLESSENIRLSALKANEDVYSFAHGNGGATLTAALCSNTSYPVTVNIGDSRIYGKNEDTNEIIRLTVDDSLAEVVGGQGTELLQFIGMGDSLSPHIRIVENDVTQLYMTSDGVHYIAPASLSAVIEQSKNIIQPVERLMALSRWCGGPDNASICAIDVSKTYLNINAPDDYIVEVIDAFSSFYFTLESVRTHNSLSKNDVLSERSEQVTPVINDKTGKPKVADMDEVPSEDIISSTDKKIVKAQVKNRKKAKKEVENEDVMEEQMVITLGNSSDNKEVE